MYKNPKTAPKSGKKTTAKKNVVFTQSIPELHFNRLSKYSKAHGFDTEQAVIRVAIVRFLEQSGF